MCRWGPVPPLEGSGAMYHGERVVWRHVMHHCPGPAHTQALPSMSVLSANYKWHRNPVLAVYTHAPRPWLHENRHRGGGERGEPWTSPSCEAHSQ